MNKIVSFILHALFVVLFSMGSSLTSAPEMESLTRSATSPTRIKIARGFKIDLLYSVPMEKQGSWVAMCMDDKNRLIVSDQYGGIYRFPAPPAGEKIDPASIEQITYAPERPGMSSPSGAQSKLPLIGHAQGLCYAFDSLYVVVNSRSSSTGAGVFRLLDTDRMISSTRSSPSGSSPPPEENMVHMPSFWLRTANTYMWSWVTKPACPRITAIPESRNCGPKTSCIPPCNIS